MGTNSKIEWTTHTFNPWIGCTMVSSGCINCYAKTTDDRHLFGQVSHWGPGAPRRITSDTNWRQPYRWAKRAEVATERPRVFCASQADIFEDEAPIEARRRLWKVIGDTYQFLDWLLLTKRPERILGVMDDDGLNFGFFKKTRCWLGTSVENEKTIARVWEILDVDAGKHFLSCEPLLSSLVIPFCKLEQIDWLICGGESGPGARRMDPDWARSLRDQCYEANVPFFMKQMGSVYGPNKGHELPDDLNIKQFPVRAQ